tara:strand:+ start:118 stop:441 length:324 start_codon:yes stop_codon:yes gene_type:complete
METLIKLIQTLIPNGVLKVNKKGNGINISNLSSSICENHEDIISQLNEEIATLGINREAKFFDKDVRKSVDDNDNIVKTELPASIAIYVPKLRKSDSDTDLLSAMSK